MPTKFNRIIKIISIVLISLIAVFLITTITLNILGAKERVGYLEVITPNLETQEDFDEVYLGVNREYEYGIRINYYDKVFRNSDILGVYINENSLPDYVISFNQEGGGSPFGKIVSNIEIDTSKPIEDITYIVKVKSHIYIYIIILLIVIVCLILLRVLIYKRIKMFKYVILKALKSKI